MDRRDRSEQQQVRLRQSRDQFKGQVDHMRLKHDKLEETNSAMNEWYQEKVRLTYYALASFLLY